MKWLLRRPDRRWHAELTRAGRSRVPLPVQPNATLRDLIAVVGVGQLQSHGPMTVTLLSVERYRDGFFLQFRLMREHRPPSRMGWQPHMKISVVDGHATPYVVGPDGGGGGGGRDGIAVWRYGYRGAPALSADAGEIVVEVPELRWRQHDGKGQLVDAEVDAGPWRFRVVL